MGSQAPGFYGPPSSPWGPAPGIVDGEFKILNTSATLLTQGPTGPVVNAAIYQADQVKVDMVPGAYNTVQVSWPAVPGFTGNYEVYSGFSLFASHAELKLTQAGVSGTFQYHPSVPSDMVPQIWVKAGSIYVQAESANVEHKKDYFARALNPLEFSNSAVVGDNDYMRFISAEIRRRAILMLQNDAEEFVLYVRRWSGRRCNCNRTQANLVTGPNSNMITGESSMQGQIPDEEPYTKDPDASMQEEEQDPQGDALARCPLCLGTGILGAYYPGITTLMRYGNLPPRIVFYKNYAVDLPQNFNTWTVWEPKLHDHDIVRRLKTGEMFEVSKPARGEWRGVPFHQEAMLNLLPPGDARYLVTDAMIRAADGI